MAPSSAITFYAAYRSDIPGQRFVAAAQHSFGDFPTEARIGDGDSRGQFGSVFGEGLAAFLQIAFHHRPDQGLVSGGALLDDAAPDIFLARVLFGGISVAAIGARININSAPNPPPRSRSSRLP